MSTEQEKHEQGRLQHDAEHERPHKRNSVLFYLVILFAAAFLLLLMSYFAQQRDRDNLEQTSNSAVQTLTQILQERDQLKAENETLEAQLTDLERQLADAQSEAEGAQDAAAEAVREANLTAQAMDFFWQIDEAYVRGRYSLCRELIASLENGRLTAYLPKESATDTDRFSPYDRYQEIYEARN